MVLIQSQKSECDKLPYGIPSLKLIFNYKDINAIQNEHDKPK